MSKQSEKTPRLIVSNKKAWHDYTIEEQFEAGLALQGWEIKSIREGRVQLKESYVLLKNGEAWLLGAHISPLLSASTHVTPDPLRTRKLLLNARELAKLFKGKERDGYTIVALDLHWHKHYAKAQIALAKGKKEYDKRSSEKDREWQREKERLLKR